ncbi:hypothetical protein WOLCODRAFT_166413 [Wolfiporia cocos MD-104 SS10]|uniref:F-box domain-containing protein n=1 Tax=Wolfiporia cocos (strain MD-104) TaxID=742152 RepID=A0A2H3J7C9_WOLCO|nr:hypothetical protein WOLCODRAFT_166413 [Wolfiporia cocos MD-104 SS10]
MDDRSPMSIPFICLQITEILENVIDLAMLGDSFRRTTAKEDRHTVLAIALTCRTFHEPALDRLWRTLFTFARLIRTLPQDSWAVFGKSIVTLIRPLTLTDWTRFELYASRVRNFGYDPHNPSASSWAGSGLTQLNLDVCAGLRLNAGQRLCHISSFSSHIPLKALTLDFSHPFGLCTGRGVNVFITTVLRHVRERCPTFIELTMKPLPSYDLLRDLNDSNPISIQIRVPSLDEEDVQCLASIHSLRQACVRLAHSDDIPSMHSALSLSASLRVLHILVSSLRSFQALLEAASFPRLEDISICAEQTPSASATQQLLAQLTARRDQSTLHTIRLFDVPSQSRHRSADEHRPPAHAHPVTARTLAPLAAFSRMRILEVDVTGLYDFDGDSVLEIVAAWPALVQLSIGTFQGSWASSGVAIGALCRVLKLCPRLQSCGVKVRLDAEDVNEERLAAHPPFSTHGRFVGCGFSLDR